MDTSQAVVEGLRFAVYGSLAVVAFRSWRRGRDASGAWLAATFVVLGVVIVVADRLPEHSDAATIEWTRKLLVALLLLFPYFLYRFAVSFDDDHRRRLDTAAHVLTAAVVGIALGVPRFPEQGEPDPGWLGVFVFVVLVQWTFLSGLAAHRLWRSGIGQPTVARRRMHLMALGSLVLNTGLVVVATDGRTTVSVVLGFVAATMFLLGFHPPAFLRWMWRRTDLVLLREAETALMRASSVQDVADVMLPHATRMLGGKGAVLADLEAHVVASHNLADHEAAAVAAAGEAAGPDVLSVPLRRLRLIVVAGRYTPFFGRDEVELLRSLAVFAELALDRVHLFEQERASRERAEQANAELETFVYSVSHDLKSPLVSIGGFLNYLRADLGEVEGDVVFYLDRMEAGVHYMDALIHDILELSRIGRVEQDVSDVDLVRVVREVADELVPASPEATVEADELPVLHMSPLRARQLFTNLVGNALAHAGRTDVHVHVSSQALDDGGVRVVVADDGKGIPAEYRERVFRVFERLERPAEGSGTGIGLAVCRKIVEQVDGTIRVGESDRGTVFELDFPAAVVRGMGVSLEGIR